MTIRNYHTRNLWTGTYAERVATSTMPGSLWYEDDTGRLFYRDSSYAWIEIPNSDMGSYTYRLQAGNDKTTSYFQGFEATSRPAGWAIAGAPFATPAAEAYSNSFVQLQWSAAANERLFLYTAGQPQGQLFGQFTLYAPSANCHIGIRLDDGTDNNYAELCYEFAAAMQLRLRINYRIGGGVPVAQYSAIYMAYPTIILFFYLPGVRWTNWGITALYGYPFCDATAFSDLAGALGFTWTPGRMGIVANKGATTANWIWGSCNWFKWTG